MVQTALFKAILKYDFVTNLLSAFIFVNYGCEINMRIRHIYLCSRQVNVSEGKTWKKNDDRPNADKIGQTWSEQFIIRA